MTTMTDTTPEIYTVTVTPSEYHATVEKIAKVNARAEKRGFTGRLEVVGERREVKTTDSLTGLERTEIKYDVHVAGEAPSYNGWTFLARIDRVGESYTIATAPGVQHVDRSLVLPGECTHCGFNRQRNNTYLVQNDETGQVVNVGSTCIKDFLGWDAQVVFYAEGDSDLEVEQGGSYYVPEYSVETVLAYAYAAIRAFGWVPASSYDGVPTREYVSLALCRSGRLSEREKTDVARMREFAAEAAEKVAAIKGYILSDDFSGASTYVENLKVVVAEKAVNGRQFGLLASAPQAYARHLGQVAERKAAAAKTQGSEYVGTAPDKAKGIKGSKVNVEGTIEQIRYSQGDYGTTTIYKILGKDGNLFTWFSSNGALGDDEGVEVKITGTVKKHEEYRGTKSTVLTRCKAVA